jgi:tetratricopeptide (TPR) repeat protein
MKIKFSFIILGMIFFQAVLADEYDAITNPESKNLVQQAIKHLSFEERTLDALQENDTIVKKIFEGYEENAAYLFAELGNYYLKAKNSSKASHSYIKAFEYLPDYEDLMSFLYSIGVREGKHQSFVELSKVTQLITNR